MNSNTNITEITKYIDGELSGNSLTQFEKLLKMDKALQDEVNFQKELIQSLKAKSEFEAEKEDLVSFLNGLEKNVDFSILANETEAIPSNKTETIKETSSQPSPKQTIFRKLLPFTTLAAAAAVLLFIISPWKSNLTGLEIAEQNFGLFQLDQVRGATDNQNILSDAQKNYVEENFQAAVIDFGTYLKGNPNSPNVWMANGSAQYKLDLYNDAIISFKNAFKQNSAYKATANWYIALTYLKKENLIEAKNTLSEISEGEDKYIEAQKLLSQIKKI